MSDQTAAAPSATPAPTVRRKRRVWPWIVGLFVAPWLLLAIVVASYVTLDRDAAALRRHVMAATGADWHTKIQLDVGRVTFGAVRSCLFFMPDEVEARTARQALAAVRHASVGVYELASAKLHLNREQLITHTDHAMQKRGWTRIVGVADGADNVLVYAADDTAAGAPLSLCIAVVNGKELVIVSAEIDADQLNELVIDRLPEEFRTKLSHAKAHVRL